MGIQNEGIEAEKWYLAYLRKKGIKCFQPDVISLENGNWIVNEVKHQEMFIPPPCFGHGLPLWQVKARMAFFQDTGIRSKLIIKEKGKNICYWQWLDILEKGFYFDTKGGNPRRVYNLESFNMF